MDMLKIEHFRLQSFPPDIWAHVVYFLPGEQLGRLKMTGSISLWSILTRHNVVKSVTLGTDYIHFKSWPAFLNEFPSIGELCITSLSSTWWSESCFRLSDVPATLIKLAIKGETSNFDNFFLDKQGGWLNINDHVPNLAVLDVCDNVISDYSWVMLLPPTITTLKIPRWGDTVELPGSLVHLTAYYNDTKTMRLPPGLETLLTNRLSGLSSLASPLASLILRLPPSLDDFSLAELISSLPRTLTEFDSMYTPIPTSLWSSLPPTLKKLVCSLNPYPSATTGQINPHIEEPLEYFPFEWLPRSLLQLELFDTRMNFLNLPPKKPSSSSAFFPPNLTTLSVPGSHLSPNAAKHLPNSVTDLMLKNICDDICQNLPRGLRRLRARSTLMSPKFIDCLPKSLTVLELTSANDNTSLWFDHDTGERVALQAMGEQYAVHKELKSLCLQSGPLPSNLTSLVLRQFADIGDNFGNQTFFNLLKLEIPDSLAISDLTIPLLNRHLTRLNLSQSRKITGKSFSDLPRDLLSLSIGNCSSVDDCDIQTLPRSLTVLHMTSATSLTDQCIKDFPRHLIVLVLTNNPRITKDCFPDLPYPLKWSTNTFLVAKFRNRNGKLVPASSLLDLS